MHACCAALWSSVNVSEWAPAAHCAACCCCVLLCPLLQDALWLDGGGSALLYSGYGACRSAGVPAALSRHWLAAAIATRASQVLRAEVQPHWKQAGPQSAGAACAVSAVLFLVVVRALNGYRHAPVTALPPWVGRCVRWVSAHALGVYVAHAAVLEWGSAALGIRPDFLQR
eukprot:TRINITY_DN11773_c0_g1_i1.p3 TRINITY_DN11773_c0_g1~~TRINITY_DN11773_c0_g1_i1.p3  ORF type:complete len:171 (+),score=43.99 TRINITY_DN11773_c0_g1_i1:876-1388(+)